MFFEKYLIGDFSKNIFTTNISSKNTIECIFKIHLTTILEIVFSLKVFYKKKIKCLVRFIKHFKKSEKSL